MVNAKLAKKKKCSGALATRHGTNMPFTRQLSITISGTVAGAARGRPLCVCTLHSAHLPRLAYTRVNVAFVVASFGQSSFYSALLALRCYLVDCVTRQRAICRGHGVRFSCAKSAFIARQPACAALRIQ